MRMYKVWCEYEMDWNVDSSHIGVYTTEGKMIEDLESKDWDDVGYESWQQAESDGMLDISVIVVK